MLSKHILQILGLVATAVGAVATIAGKVIDDKRQDSVIDEKVAKALAEQQAKNTSETNDEEES